jgi:hypothetical protein
VGEGEEGEGEEEGGAEEEGEEVEQAEAGREGVGCIYPTKMKSEWRGGGGGEREREVRGEAEARAEERFLAASVLLWPCTCINPVDAHKQ